MQCLIMPGINNTDRRIEQAWYPHSVPVVGHKNQEVHPPLMGWSLGRLAELSMPMSVVEWKKSTYTSFNGLGYYALACR